MREAPLIAPPLVIVMVAVHGGLRRAGRRNETRRSRPGGGGPSNAAPDHVAACGPTLRDRIPARCTVRPFTSAHPCDQRCNDVAPPESEHRRAHVTLSYELPCTSHLACPRDSAGGNQGAPGSAAPGWAPDLAKAEHRLTLVMMSSTDRPQPASRNGPVRRCASFSSRTGAHALVARFVFRSR
jgi:hypothetical protein